MSRVEKNKALMRDFIDTWNRGDFDKLPSFWAPDIVHHTRSSHNKERIMKSYETTMKAFPDLHWSIEDLFAEGDRVVMRLTGSATHLGEFLGTPPTGRKITCRAVDICRVEDEKITEHWGMLDELQLLGELELVPAEYLSAM